MATNAEPVVDDDKEVTEEDLHDLKYGSDDVETSKEADETDETDKDEEDSKETGEEDGQTDDDTEEEDEEDDSTEESDDTTSEFVKEFPNIKGDTPEEYAKNLEEAYKNSTAEFQRLRQQAPEDKADEVTVDTSDPIALYMKQKMDSEITDAFDKFSKDYSEVTDPVEYNKFTVEVATLSKTILDSQKRLASPEELYKKAAVILGWEKQSIPSDKEKLNMSLKDKAASSKTSSGSSKTSHKSKVTDSMIKVNRMMYPDKSDDEIRKELEEYV